MDYISDEIDTIFIETSVFSKKLPNFMDDEVYRMFQLYLSIWPNAGSVIKHSGGLRKIRWKIDNGGKRGGIRIIYYIQKQFRTIYLLLAYSKSQKDDLTPEQLKQLKSLITSELL